jgi:hypothetical protein
MNLDRIAVQSKCPRSFATVDYPWGGVKWSVYGADTRNPRLLGRADTEEMAWLAARWFLYGTGELERPIGDQS